MKTSKMSLTENPCHYKGYFTDFNRRKELLRYLEKKMVLLFAF